jgi:CheY-like chemotaxis protein
MTVLIVEDEALIAHNLKFTLEAKGWNVILAYTYNQAIQLIDNGGFEIFVTDINLNEVDKSKNGISLITHIRKNSNLPIIVLTAFSNDELIEEALNLKIDNYLVKPINPITLYASVRMLYSTYYLESADEDKESFFVKIGNKSVKVDINTIYYLGASKNYVIIKVFEKNIDIPYRGSLQEFFDLNIPDHKKKEFIKINRGEIILKKIVTSVKKTTLETPYGTFKISPGITVKDFE